MPPKAKADNAGYLKLKKDLSAGTPGKLYLFHGEETYLWASCGNSCLPGGWGSSTSTNWGQRICPPMPWRRPSTACP